MASVNIHTVRLTFVLSNLVVDSADNVGPHRRLEDDRQAHCGTSRLIFVIIDGDQRAGRCKRHTLCKIKNFNKELE